MDKYSFTDIHTHILPGMDDGAESLETALNILRLQKKKGIDRVALTPHYYPQREELNTFLERRQRTYCELLASWDGDTMPQMCLGAEVHYTPLLPQMDLHQMTIGQGRYLLLELPVYGSIGCLPQVVEQMLTQGITPILAHIERCLVFRKAPDQLYSLVQMGAIAQIDAFVLKNKKTDKFAGRCLQNGLAHVVASDIHNLSDRMLCLTDIASEQNVDLLHTAEQFARAVWDNRILPHFRSYPVKRGIFNRYL